MGALAVAFGIGGAMLGFTPVAAADAGDAPGAGQDSGRSVDSAHRRGSKADRSGESAAPAAAGEAPADRSARSGRGSGAAESGQEAEIARNADAPDPAVAVTQAPAAAVEPAPAIGPDAGQVVIEELVVPTTVDVEPASPADGAVSENVVVAPVEIDVVADEVPVMTAAAPDVLSEGDADPTALLGEEGTGEPGAEPLAWAALAVTRREDLAGATPEVAAAAAVTTGEPAEPLAAAAGELAAATFQVPATPSGCSNAVCSSLVGLRPTVIADIADAVVAALGPSAGQAGGCSGNTCPASPANYIGAYGFNVIYALMGATNFSGSNPLPNTTVGATVQALFAQPEILTFVSQEIASSTVLAKLPPAVAQTMGNAVGTFIVNSFGNTTVANAIVPFLRALNIPTSLTQAGIFAASASSNVFAAILSSGSRQINPTGMQSALVTFFTTPGVQSQMAAAMTAAVNVLLGLDTQPSWVGQPQVSPTALADFLGQLGADALLPASNPYNPALAATIGSAVQTLFANIGGVVATQAGVAFEAFLNAPGQNVPNILATTVVNGLVEFLQVGAGQQPSPPFPSPPSLAPAAEIAVTGFMNAVISTPSVTAGLRQFFVEVVPGILGNRGVQEAIGSEVAKVVEKALIGYIGKVVGPQVGAAIAALLSDPTISAALTTFADTVFTNLLSTDGVVPALSNAAVALGNALLEGNFDEVLPQVEEQLRTNPAIAEGVGAGVTAAVAGLLSDKAVWVQVDSTLSALLSRLLGQADVQEALANDVAAIVEKRFPGPVGQFLGAQLGGVVVALATNPVIGAGLGGVVDTLFSDFWGSPGVITAFSDAAGELASAAVSGDLETVAPEVTAALQANPDVQAAVEISFGSATREFLSDGALWDAIDQTLSAAVISFTTDPAVLGALGDSVESSVEALLGEPLGGVVGPQVGAAVVSLVSNPVVSNALLGVVNTLFSDFVSAPGVVDAFSAAASQWGLVLLTTGSLAAATKAAQEELKDRPAVANGVDVSVTAAVAQLLGNTELWAVLDQTVSSLTATLFSDSLVQQALGQQVSALVADKIPGPLGVVVGDAVGTAVVSLVASPVIGSAVNSLVDTLFSDFWGSPGVVTAFSEAAGALVTAALEGDLDTVAPQIQAALRANPDVEAAADLAVGDAVRQFLGDTAVWTTVDATLTALVSGLLGNPEVTQALYETVDVAVETLIGGPLGAVVGPQVATAVVSLLTSPVIGAALNGLVDTLFSDFFGAPGVIDAFGTAAGLFAEILVTGGSAAEAEEAAKQQLKASPAVENGVDVSVTAAVAELLGNTRLWAELDQTVSSLAAALLGDSLVQQALGQQVSLLVADKIPGPLGVVVGDALGTAVVSLVTSPVIGSALNSLVETLFSEFWGSPGVVTAFSEAAGTLATAALVGDLDTVAPEVRAALQANPDVKAAADLAVGDAVRQLLGDTAVWTTVDATLTALVSGLFSNPEVAQALYDTVDVAVETLIGGPLGAVVGPQVATAVVSLLTSPVVGAALHGLVDTLFSDFFGAPGVVDAFGTAAGVFAQILVTGGSAAEAEEAAKQELKASPAVENGVDVSVTAAVAELLGNTELWAVLDQTVSSLAAALLGDSLVQQALGQQVSLLVADKIPGPLGVAVGDALGTAVVSLVTNPAIGSALSSLVDTLFSDFWGSPGVVTAYSEAAGTLATAALVGDLDTVAPQVRAALRANPDVEAAVDGSVTAAVAGILGDRALWTALDSVLSTLAVTLLDDPAVQQALNEGVSSLVAAKIGGPLGASVGPRVGVAVVSLLSSPAIQSGVGALVDTLLSDFFGTTGVVDAFAGAAGELALAVFTGGDLAAALKQIEESLRTNADVNAGVDLAVSAGVSQLLSDTDLWTALDSTLTSLVSDLVNDPVFEDALYDTVASLVGGLIGGDLGVAVGTEVATAVVALLMTPAVTGGVNDLVDTLFSDFLGAPGVIGVLSDAAGTLASAAVYGNLDTVKPVVEQEVRTNPDIDAAVYGAVSAGASQFFGNTAVLTSLDTVFTYFATNLLRDSVVQQAAGAAVAGLVSGFLGDSPLAKPVGQAIGVAVEEFLATAGIASDLGAIIGSVIPDFLGQPGVATGLGSALGDFAVALVVGDDLTEAIQIALDDLKSNGQVVAGLQTTIADALNLVDTTILGDLTVQQSLGAITTNLIVTLADSPQVQAYVLAQFGPLVAGLLSNHALVEEFAGQLGLAVTDLLGYPGVSTAITDSLNVFADELIGGANAFEALDDALKYLQANPAFEAGVNAVIPGTLNTILTDPAVLGVIGTLARQEAVAALQSFGIKNKFIGNVVGQVVEGTTLSFLTRPAGLGLVDGLVVNVMLGMPLSDAGNYIGHEVFYSFNVRWALGFSVGQGIGSLFGDNIVARLIGAAAGVPVTVTLGVVAAIERFLDWLSPGRSAAPAGGPAAAAALPNGSQYFQPIPSATDLYVMNAVLLDRRQAEAAREALVGDGRLTLTGMTINDPDVDQPGSLDITMSVEAADHQDGENPLALLALRFPLDRLIQAPA